MIFDIFKKIFYPDDYGCIVCERRGKKYSEHGDAVICDECIGKFHKVKAPVCIKCGRPVGSEDSLCRICAQNEFPFELAASVYVYKGEIKSIVHRLKYSGEQWLAEFAGKEMSKKYASLGWNCDIVTYVPMYHAKEKKRGYNQAQLLAEIVAKQNDIECLPLLLRTKNTTPQSFLDKEERMSNLTNTICADDVYKDKIADKRILVIDDIITTGSSLNECSRALLDAGADKIYGLCMCSVDNHQDDEA